MTIRHHLSEQLLTGYAAGQLPEAFNLIVATHVSLCDECRARLAALEAVGGALIEEIDEIAMGERHWRQRWRGSTGCRRQRSARR
jgi:putative transcriptional regulator